MRSLARGVVDDDVEATIANAAQKRHMVACQRISDEGAIGIVVADQEAVGPRQVPVDRDREALVVPRPGPGRHLATAVEFRSGCLIAKTDPSGQRKRRAHAADLKWLEVRLNTPSMWSARRSASATMVIVGVSLPHVGKTELPAT